MFEKSLRILAELGGEKASREDHHGSRPARGRGGSLLGADCRTLRVEPHSCERGRRSHLPFYDCGLGRLDPHGPFITLCDAEVDWPEGSLRDCLRLRHRPRREQEGQGRAGLPSAGCKLPAFGDGPLSAQLPLRQRRNRGQTPGARIPAIAAVSLVSLAVLGAFGGHLGGAPLRRAALRVALGGALAMAVTAAIGRLFGVSMG